MTLEGATVYVLDDDASFVRSTVRLLESWGITAEGFTSPSVFLARESFPERACLILDQHMPRTNGLQVQQVLASRPRPLLTIFVSGHADVPAAVGAVRAGAVDFLLKPVDEQRLLAAVHRAIELDVEGEARRSRRDRARERLACLASLDLRICELFVTGMSDDRIAGELGCSEREVRLHRSRILKLASVDTIVELVHLLEAADAR